MRIIKTFILTDIAWIFFRADTSVAAITILKNSFDLSNIGLILNGGFYQLGLNERNMSILLLSLLILLLYSLMKETGRDVLAWLSEQNILFRFIIYWGAVFLIVCSLDIMGQEFIYFQF